MRRLGILGFVAWLLAAALPAQAQQVNLYCNTGSGLTAWQPASAANPCPVNATASISGFPGTQTTGTPISVTTGGVSGTLPSGTEVVATNVGTTNAAYCKLGASATTSDQYIAPNGGWFGFTVGSATQLTCITSTSTTTVNMVGGSGIPTGTGGGGGSSGGGGAVTIGDGADVAQGTTTDAACATDNGTCTEVALIKRNNQRLTTLNTTLGTPFQAGGSIGNTTFAATQSGTWTVQPGNTPNTTPWLQIIRDAAGNARGANVDASNRLSTLAFIDPSSTNPNGQATMANSAPVVIASNQSAVPVSGASGAFASGSFASGSHASGSFASGSFASGALASGSVASGAMVDLGAQADSACATDNGTCSAIALIKRTNQRITTTSGSANAYETVAASQTGQALGATGGTGDYLSHCVIYPVTTSPGVVTVFDNTNAAGTNAIAFAGGATSVSNLAPISVPVGAVSTAGAWKVTTGTNVIVTCYGRFT